MINIDSESCLRIHLCKQIDNGYYDPFQKIVLLS